MSVRPRFNLNRSGGKPFAEKYPRLLAELEECFGEGEKLMVVVRDQLTRLES